MNCLKTENLSLTYKNGVKAINNVSIEIGNGMFGLLGPNGAGKSSFMKTIVGLQRPSSGNIRFNEKDIVRDPGFLKKQLGFLPQDFGVYPKATAFQLLDHLAVLKGIGNKKQRTKQVSNLLEKVNLSAFQHKEVHSFSGGMRQRFGIAQALLGNPQIIIVDEPTAGLDPEERNRFNGILSEISKEVVVILSTHLVEDVRNLCSRMAIMQNGAIVVQGRPKELVNFLQGKTWTKAIDKSNLPQIEQSYHVISKFFIENKMMITVFSEHKPEGFEPQPPGLEDFYFYTIKQPVA